MATVKKSAAKKSTRTTKPKPKAKAAGAEKQKAPGKAPKPLQKLSDDRAKVKAEELAAKKVYDKAVEKRKDIDKQLTTNGAVPGMQFIVNGKPMEMTAPANTSPGYSKAIELFSAAHPEHAEELAKLVEENTTRTHSVGFRAAA